MIGKVSFTDWEQQPQILVLEDDGSFQCPEEAANHLFEEMLQQHKQQYSPSMGPWGTMLLTHFAHRVKGSVEFEDKPQPQSPDDKPLVY